MAFDGSIKVKLHLSTPAFAGGVRSDTLDTLRPPTIKSLLRWWWRTKHPRWSGEDLYNAEAVVWGSAPFRRDADDRSKPPRGGQGTRLIPGVTIQEIRGGQFSLSTNNLRYLAYGVMAPEGEQTPTNPPCLSAGTTLEFRLVPHPRAKKKLVNELYHALWLMSTFGGIGQRSRRGWGSVRLETDYPGELPDVHTHNKPVKAIAAGLKTILGARSTLPEASDLQRPGFSQHARVLVGPPRGSAKRALAAIGSKLFQYRKLLGSQQDGAGPDCRKRRVWLRALDGRCQADPHPIDTSQRRLPRGSAFGLPHNAYFKKEQKTLRIGVGPDLGGRRASPLLISVIGSKNRYRPVVLWLPTMFLPDGLIPYAAVDDGAAFPLEIYEQDGVRQFLEGASDMEWNGLANQQGWVSL